MYHVSAQGVDERMINVHYYYYIVAIAKRLGLIQKNVGQKSGEWTIMRKLTRQSKRTRQKKKRGGRKGDSNDSPMIPDRVGTAYVSYLPSGNLGKVVHAPRPTAKHK